MSIQTIINRASPFKMMATRSNPEPDFVAKEITRTEEELERYDKFIRSIDLHSVAPTEGLIYTLKTPEESAAMAQTGGIKVKTLYNSLEEQYLAPSDNQWSDYFFVMDTRFIQNQAKTILSGGEFDQDDNITNYFARGLEAWFSEDDVLGARDSLKKLCTEYAGRMKNGDSLDLHSFETTFTIQGETVTLGQILDMSNAARLLEGNSQPGKESIYGSGCGTHQFDWFAAKGTMKAAALAYAKTLPGTLGHSFDAYFTDLWDDNAQDVLDTVFYKNTGGCDSYNAIWKRATAQTGYDLFSGLDFSSRETAQSSFQNAMKQFEQMVDSGGYSYWWDYFKGHITKAFTTACQALF